MALYSLGFFLFFLVVSAKVPLLGQEHPELQGQYIVIFHENITTEEFTTHLRVVSYNTPIKFTYKIGDTFKGFAAKLDDKTLSDILDNPHVKEVHYDGMETIFDNSCGSYQYNAPSWGIARTSHKGGVGNGLNDDYYYDATYNGNGVTAYVLDTGIYIGHSNFGGRASIGANFVDSVATDQNGHGTHCAGTIGGSTFGIAKGVNLVSVKVLGASGSGSTAGVIAGIDYVTDQHLQYGGPSVASMSLGSASDGGKNAAIRASVLAGVVYSVAAGNSNGDACYYYPASSPDAISVGSTNIATSGGEDYDERSSFSNYGTCVAIFAPGSAITSAGISSSTSSSVKSGTSMACPHVTGVVALFLSETPNATPAAIKSRLISYGQVGLIYNPGTGSPNLLLYTGCDEA
jgi:serine protease